MQKRSVCNICGNRTFKTVFRLKGFDVICCGSCGTLCRDVIFDAGESRDLYGKDYFCDFQKDYFFDGSFYREKACERKISVINSIRPERGKLLDIGCGTGFFLKAALSSGWDIEGIDISEFAASYARTKLHVPVRAGDFLEFSFAPGSFDVITMWDMIDHSEYPADIMKKVHTLLKPDGIVAMDTFMIDGLLFKSAELLYRMSAGFISHPVRRAYPVHHSHYFSTLTFSSLARRNHFEIIYRQGTHLEAQVVSLGFWGKRFVAAVNRLTDFVGTKMEMMLVGRKRA